MDIRGGLVGFVGDYDAVDAICLTGGSLYGLEAVSGVMAEMFARKEWSLLDIATVSGACIFDYPGRDKVVYPDLQLGRAALRAAREGAFPLGRRGAGIHAGVGQGGAFRREGDVRIAVFTVVNAPGAVVDREGRVGKERILLAGELAEDTPVTQHTTLTAVVTDQTLSRRELVQVGRQVHASMGRVIQAFHTLNDGDVLFTLSTRAAAVGTLHSDRLADIASELAWDAVLCAVEG